MERSKILNEQVYTVFPSAKFNEADQHYHPKVGLHGHAKVGKLGNDTRVDLSFSFLGTSYSN